MIKTGIDVAEVRRFAEMKNLDGFLHRVFSKEEQAYLSAKKTPFESIAGHFAAKEAFSKYMGSGLRGFAWGDIEVLHDSIGKPYIRFMGCRSAADVSISHSDTVAVAVVCGEESPVGGCYAEHIKAYRALLPKRWDDMHKGDCGRVFIVAGSKGMTGAAALCAQAALRSGSGLVTVGVPKSEQPILAIKLTEAMTLPLEEENGVLSEKAAPAIEQKASASDACILGPGLGKVNGLQKIIAEVVQSCDRVLLDADGLNALAEHIDVLQCKNADVVLTPHPGEMARLTGYSIEKIEENREAVASEFAQKWGVTVLLKGKGTVIASKRGEVHINPSGNRGMASGGMGDVLSGGIGSLMGQGLDGYRAAVLGAFLHGLAGDIAQSELGEFGMIAGDVLKRLPHAFSALQRP